MKRLDKAGERYYGSRMRGSPNAQSLSTEGRSPVSIPLARSMRFAGRRLLRSPAFTLGVTLLLAWGIGAGAALLSIVDAVFFRPLEVQHPGELVRLVQRNPPTAPVTQFPHALFEALEPESREFSRIAGELEFRSVLSAPAPAQQVRASFVTAQYFSLLGVSPLLGRVLTPDDDRDGSDTEPAVLNYTFWNTRFHRDPRVLGQSIQFNSRPFVIVGVMPRSFHGLSADTTTDVILPSHTFGWLATKNGMGAPPWLSIMGRLRPEVTRTAAQAAVRAVWRQAVTRYWTDQIPRIGQQLAKDNLAEDLRLGVELESERRGNSILRDKYGTGWVLLGASALVLVALLCANLATIALSRNAASASSLAVRFALGATRGQLFSTLLSEYALLAAVGTIAGILLAYLLIPFLVDALPPVRNPGQDALTTAIEAGRDWRPLMIGLVLGLGSFLGFGCAPAWSALRAPVKGRLQPVQVSQRLGAQRRLLLVQVALCTLLLSGASLLERSFTRLRSSDPGFTPAGLVSFTFNPDLRSYTDDQANRLRQRLVAQVQALPGVASVAEARLPVMRGTGIKAAFAPQGVRMSADSPLNVTLDPVSDSFFRTMGMTIIKGRNLPQNQGHQPEKVQYVVVNQALTRLFFGGLNPLGRRFGPSGFQDAYEVVGVVSDAKFRSLREIPPPTVYEDAAGIGRFSSVLYVRTRLPERALIEPVRRIFAGIDPTLPVTDAATMEEELDAATAGERFTSRMASALALFAAILAGLGIYGLMALVVTESRRELAIHLAVGASRLRVIALVSMRFLSAVAAGSLAGLGSAWLLAPLLRSMLYAISRSDPASLLAPPCAVAAVAVIGSLGPLLRLMSIEPAAALRPPD